LLQVAQPRQQQVSSICKALVSLQLLQVITREQVQRRAPSSSSSSSLYQHLCQQLSTLLQLAPVMASTSSSSHKEHTTAPSHQSLAHSLVFLLLLSPHKAP
jgi:hypothetical protein